MLFVNHCPSRRETRKQGSKQTALALPSAGSNEKERCRYGRAMQSLCGKNRKRCGCSGPSDPSGCLWVKTAFVKKPSKSAPPRIPALVARPLGSGHLCSDKVMLSTRYPFCSFFSKEHCLLSLNQQSQIPWKQSEAIRRGMPTLRCLSYWLWHLQSIRGCPCPSEAVPWHPSLTKINAYNGT